MFAEVITSSRQIARSACFQVERVIRLEAADGPPQYKASRALWVKNELRRRSGSLSLLWLVILAAATVWLYGVVHR